MAKKVAAAADPLTMGDDAVADELISVPFKKLILDDLNARRDHVSDPALMANIAAHGLLMPLLVRRSNDNDLYSVVDGGRRYVTIKIGIETGQLPQKDFQTVMCRVVHDEKAALEISMSANLHKSMHPLDVCETVHELAKTAEGEKAIAAHFGETVAWVQQRAKLAELTEKAKTLYRVGGMTLGAAIAMTRLSSKDQDRLCKQKVVSENDVRDVMSRQSVDCNLAMFDWKNEYPKEKQQGSLFDDITLLLDVPLFKDMQAKAMLAKVNIWKDLGYNIVNLDRNDYNTSGKYVHFTGKRTKEMIPSLSILIRPKFNELEFEIQQDMIDRKLLAKIEKGGKGKTDTTSEAPKPMKASDLSRPQDLMMRTHMGAALHAHVQGDGSELIRQFIVIKHAFGGSHLTSAGLHGYSGQTDRRWGTLTKDQEKEFAYFNSTVQRGEARSLTLEHFAKMKADAREKVYRAAVASLIDIDSIIPLKTLAQELPLKPKTWLERLGAGFFGKYRGDQLLDYLKKSNGSKPTDGKKVNVVNCALDAASSKTAWQFGLD